MFYFFRTRLLWKRLIPSTLKQPFAQGGLIIIRLFQALIFDLGLCLRLFFRVFWKHINSVVINFSKTFIFDHLLAVFRNRSFLSGKVSDSRGNSALFSLLREDFLLLLTLFVVIVGLIVTVVDFWLVGFISSSLSTANSNVLQNYTFIHRVKLTSLLQ